MSGDKKTVLMQDVGVGKYIKMPCPCGNCYGTVVAQAASRFFRLPDENGESWLVTAVIDKATLMTTFIKGSIEIDADSITEPPIEMRILTTGATMQPGQKLH